MTKQEKLEVRCPECGTEEHFEAWASINVKLNPELKQKLFDGEINVYHCISCDTDTFIDVPLLYNDPNNEFIVQFYPFDMIDDDEFLDDYDDQARLHVVPDAIYDKLPEYLKSIHIVFTIQELLRYIVFRDRLTLRKSK